MRYIGGRFELRKPGLLALKVGKDEVLVYSELDNFDKCSREHFISEYVYRDGRAIDKVDLDLSNSPFHVLKKNKLLVEARYDTVKGVWIAKYNKMIREFNSELFYHCFEPYREECTNEVAMSQYMREKYKIKCTYMNKDGAFESVWTMQLETDRYAYLEPDRYAYYEGNLKLIMIPRGERQLTIGGYAKEIKEWTEASGIQKIIGYKMLEKATGKVLLEF